MKSAFESPPGLNVQTPETLSHPHSKNIIFTSHHKTTSSRRAQRQMMAHRLKCFYTLMHTSPHTISLSKWDLFIFTIPKQQTSIIQNFLPSSRQHSFFFSFYAFRSPTNELNTDKTWKWLEKAVLCEQRTTIHHHFIWKIRKTSCIPLDILLNTHFLCFCAPSEGSSLFGASL